MKAVDELFPDSPRVVDMERSATVSDCGRYRYDLTRQWSAGPTVVWVMLNPSVADASLDDPTLRRVIGYSRAGGYGAAVLVNVFALRTPDTKVLLRAAEPVGPRNDRYIDAWALKADRVVVGWGAFTVHRWRHKDRPKEVLARLRGLRDDGLWCVERTAGGHPRHPLYCKKANPLIPFA